MASAADLLAFFRSYFTPAGRQAAWNLAWMLGGRLVSQASLLLVVLLLTRALGREQFGIFSTALALQGYIVILGSAGMPDGRSARMRAATAGPQRHQLDLPDGGPAVGRLGGRAAGQR